MAEGSKTVTLRVAEAKTRDLGRGIARIDSQIVKELGLKTGDVIQIENYSKNAKTAALVWPSYSEDDGTGIIRIDGSIRDNIKEAIDERVHIHKIKAQMAELVELSPIQNRLVVRNEQYFSQLLENRVVTQSDIVSFMIMGQRIEFVVSNYRPKTEAVVITLKTKVSVNREAVTEDFKFRTKSRMSWEDIGGLKEQIKILREMIELPLHHPEIFDTIGIAPPKGVLLYDPHGTGKTSLARVVANETQVHFISLSGPEITSKFYGASEENLRKIFKEAQEKSPSIIFIDEIDAIAPNREEIKGEYDRRIVAQLIALMDNMEGRGEVFVIATTSNLKMLDPALLHADRFDCLIEITTPNKQERLEILQIITRDFPLADEFDFADVAEQTEGLAGADLKTIARNAAFNAVRRILPETELNEPVSEETLESIIVTQEDFLQSARDFPRSLFIEKEKN